MVWGQMTHAQLTLELLRDLNHAVEDSLHDHHLAAELIFDEDQSAGSYLSQIWSDRVSIPSQEDKFVKAVQIEILAFKMEINRASNLTPGNKTYTRRLDLNVRIEGAGEAWDWKGGTSDHLSNQELALLLNADFPSEVGGDYMDGAPGIKRVILLTLSLFGLFAALFFVRT